LSTANSDFNDYLKFHLSDLDDAELEMFDGDRGLAQLTGVPQGWDRVQMDFANNEVPSRGSWEANAVNSLFQSSLATSGTAPLNLQYPNGISQSDQNRTGRPGIAFESHLGRIADPNSSSRRYEGNSIPASTSSKSPQEERDFAHEHCQSGQMDDVKIFTTKILDCSKRMTAGNEEFVQERRNSSGMSRASSANTGSIGPGFSGTRRFIEMIFSESQAFSTVLRRIQYQQFKAAASRDSRSSPSSQMSLQMSTMPSPEQSDRSFQDAHDPSEFALDFQCSLAIVSCYASMIQGFDKAFQEILTLMKEVEQNGRIAGLSDCIPNVSVGRADCGSGSTIQIMSLTYIGLAIIENIEDLIGITTTPECPRNGLLCGVQSQGLLDALFGQKDLAHQETDGTRVARVKRTIEDIQEASRTARRR
jgi:hypothetical protein